MNKQKEINYLDKIKGGFIATLASLWIFKIFIRGFNKKIAWFNRKTSSIVRISIIMRSSKEYISPNESLD